MTTLVFLIDVDNTLINNDEIKSDLDAHIKVDLGEKLTARYWEIYEQVRKERDVAIRSSTTTRSSPQSIHTLWKHSRT